MLGASARLDPGLDWLFEALSPLPPSDSSLVPTQFERELPPEALNEQLPRVTSIDFLVQTSKLVICTEAKRGEDGMGRCSCPPGAPKVAGCSRKVLDRPLYWRAAYDLFGMPDRAPGKPCPVSLRLSGHPLGRRGPLSRDRSACTGVLARLRRREPLLQPDRRRARLAARARAHPLRPGRSDPFPGGLLAGAPTEAADRRRAARVGEDEAPPPVLRTGTLERKSAFHRLWTWRREGPCVERV